MLTIALGLPFRYEDEPDTIFQSILSSVIGYREEDIAPSPSVQFIRLRTGKLLTLRVLPQSKNQTIIECNVYSKLANDSIKTRSEVSALKDNLQSRMEDLELEHRKLLSGTTEISSCKYLYRSLDLTDCK